MKRPVRLSPHELMLAAQVGIMRQIANLRDGRVDRYGAPKDNGWQIHIEGACGEMAVAKVTDRYWSGNIGDLGAADVGRIQVRTRSRDDYDLIVHLEDRDADAFVLVTGSAPRYQVVGWIVGLEAKRPEWWKDPAGGRPAFFVPQAALADVATLCALAIEPDEVSP